MCSCSNHLAVSLTLFLGLAALASGFNDDMGMTYKWSPENLYKSVYRKPSSMGTDDRAYGGGVFRPAPYRPDSPRSLYRSLKVSFCGNDFSSQAFLTFSKRAQASKKLDFLNPNSTNR